MKTAHKESYLNLDSTNVSGNLGSATPASAQEMCVRCVMDRSDPLITFDEAGVCNHCRNFEEKSKTRLVRGEEGQKLLAGIVERIKEEGKGKEYDCIAGVSGGVDSTYVIYLAKQLGLRPLAVHLDNGWNSELAVHNIEKILSKLDIDLYTYVIDWEEFRDLQLSFLRGSTPDSEIPTDHAIYALLMRVALEKKIRFVLNGMNYASESAVVYSWAYGHSDWRYIKNVQKRFGSMKLKSFPHFSIPYLANALLLRKLKFVSLLNYIDYDKAEAVALLEKELGWRPYGGKHHESIYTRFFQSYILPKKFGIDKRKAHLSNLIQSSSGGMTREKALAELTTSPCDERQMEEDKEFVIKKFNLTPAEFDQIMKLPAKSHLDYKTNFRYIVLLKRFQNFLRKLGILYK